MGLLEARRASGLRVRVLVLQTALRRWVRTRTFARLRHGVLHVQVGVVIVTTCVCRIRISSLNNHQVTELLRVQLAHRVRSRKRNAAARIVTFMRFVATRKRAPLAVWAEFTTASIEMVAPKASHLTQERSACAEASTVRLAEEAIGWPEAKSDVDDGGSVESAFKELDADGGGTISATELEAGLAEIAFTTVTRSSHATQPPARHVISTGAARKAAISSRAAHDGYSYW